MDKKISSSAFNHNIESSNKIQQNVTIQSPLFGGIPFKLASTPEEKINQNSISSHLIHPLNISASPHLIVNPQAQDSGILNYLSKESEKQDLSRKSSIRRGFHRQNISSKKLSVSPSREELKRNNSSNGKLKTEKPVLHYFIYFFLKIFILCVYLNVTIYRSNLQYDKYDITFVTFGYLKEGFV